MKKNWVINNQYEIIEKIGIGGFATVYRAWDNMLQKYVAIKKIHEEYSAHAEYLDMFRQEAINTAKLEHENIVRVVNFIKDAEGNSYIIMDYVKGVDLEYLIKKCRQNKINIPMEISLYIMSEVLKALDYAHSAKDSVHDKPLNMIHRDISPGNVMLYFDGRIKLTDFGIAKAGEQQIKSRNKNKLKGKMSYMSPEQAEGEDLDSRSDLFSAGIVLFETLIQKKVFQGESDIEIWQKVKSANIDFKKLKDRQIDEHIIKILKKILQRSLEKRYQNAAEIYIELKRYLMKKVKQETLMKEYRIFIKDIFQREIAALKKEKTDFVDNEISSDHEELNDEDEIDKQTDESITGDKPDDGDFEETEEEEIELEELESKVELEELEAGVELEELGGGKRPKKIQKKVDQSAEKAKEKKEDRKKESGQDKPELTAGQRNPEKEIKKASKVAIPELSASNVPDVTKKIEKESTDLSDIQPISYSPKREPIIPETKADIKKSDNLLKEKAKQHTKPKKKPEHESMSKLKLVREEAEKKPVKQGDYRAPISERDVGVSEPMNEYIEQQSSDKEKTVIDFVLDTAKRYKKVFISIVVASVIIFINFIVIDTFMQFTAVGVKIHNIIWPPALQLDSSPSNARVELIKNDIDLIEKGEYRAVTPTFINKIQPGLYTLRLTKEGYGTVVRRVTVFGRHDQDQAIAIAGARVINGVYVVPFEIGFEINSLPDKASLYIDGKKIGSTPFTGSVEIGKHNFVLMKEGFETLGKSDIEIGYNLNTVKYTLGICLLDSARTATEQTTVDYRFWNIKGGLTKNGAKNYIMKGTLWKRVNITSVPEGSKVFINNSDDSIGITPIKNVILPAGKHSIGIEKDGYIPYSGSVSVTASSTDKISTVLKKIITVYSYQSGKSSKKDINAKITVKGTRFSGKTPLKVILPHGKYTFNLSKPPSFKPASVTKNIGSLGDTLKIKMELRPPYLNVRIVDFITGKGVRDATLWIDGKYWRRTNNKGIAADYIYKPSGEFNIEVKTEKYDSVKSSVYVKRGQRKSVKLKVGVPKDGKLIIEISEEFIGTSIYIDGEYAGEDSQVISEVTRSEHDIEFKFNTLDKNITKKINIKGSNQILILKPVKKGKKIQIEVEKPPYLEINVKDFRSEKNIGDALVYINGVEWRKTAKNGTIKAYLEEFEGELFIELETEGYDKYKTVLNLNKNQSEKLNIRLGAPKDGTIVLDIPSSYGSTAVYLNGEYIGEQLSLISDVPRITHIVEIKSELFEERVIKKISFTKPNHLIMLRLIKDNNKIYLKELSPDLFWQE